MQADSYNKPNDRLEIDPSGHLFFYARLVNTNSLTSFVNTIAKTGNNWVVHIYGDSAAVCAVTSFPSPQESREMLECMTDQLVNLGVKEVELVAFKGDISLLGSLVLVLREREVRILESSLPKNLDLEGIKRRMESIKGLKERFKVGAPEVDSRLKTGRARE